MAAEPNRLRWFQWRLRTLLAIVTVCAVATAFFIAPRVREQAVVGWLQEKDAQITFEAEGPGWLRHLIGDKFLQRVVGVKIVEKPIAGSDLSRFDALPRLRTLQFTDSILGEFFRARFVHRDRLISPSLSSLSVADAEQFADDRPDVACDIAFAESLYRASAHQCETNAVQLREALFACQTAARWKMACARCKGQATAAIAAQEQLVHWLEGIASQLDAKIATRAKGTLPGDAALAKCALLNAKLALARARQNRSAELAASNEAGAVTAELLRITDPASGDGPIDPYRVDIAWSYAFDLLLAEGRRDSGDEAERVVLKRQVDAFSDLTAKLGILYAAGEPGGETEKLELARINLALAEARLARARGENEAARRALENALPMAKNLRGAVSAAYEVGTITMPGLLYSAMRATELEAAFAEAIDDTDMKRAVADAHIELIERVWRKRAALPYTSVGGGSGDDDEWIGCLLRCLLAVHRLERDGCAVLSDTVGSFAPRVDSFHESSEDVDMLDPGPDEGLPRPLGSLDDLE